MAEDTESGKKRRVIHWNPETGKSQSRSGWKISRILGWTAGGFVALLLAAGVVIRGIKLVWGPEVFSGSPAVANAPADSTAAFVSQQRAEFEYAQISRAMEEVRKLPNQHPTQQTAALAMEKLLIDSETQIARRNFGNALGLLERLNVQLDAFNASVQARQKAQDGFNQVLQQLRELEPAGFLLPEALEAANTAAAESQSLFRDGSFVLAEQSLERGFAELDRLERARGEFITGNLGQGQQAISQGRAAAAQTAFEAVLNLDPGNADAARGLERAANAERVYARLVEARNLESQGRYADAAQSYARAFELDPYSAAAQEGQSRANRLEKDSRFDAAVARADEAARQRNWDSVIAAAREALQVYPERTEMTDRIAQAQENAHLDSVNRGLQNARVAEDAFLWQDARQAYQSVLALEPNQPDAVEGFERAGRMIRAQIDYEVLIDQASKLAENAEFQRAIATFNEAAQSKPSFVPYTSEVLALKQLLELQSRPVSVTFISDGRTFVSISGYLEPSQFKQKTLSILPGDYNILGKRAGYRDVPVILKVRATSAFDPISIVCTVRADR